MIDTERLNEQMRCSRYEGGRLERLEGDEWVPWPVLTMDKLGVDKAARTIAHAPKRRA